MGKRGIGSCEGCITDRSCHPQAVETNDGGSAF